MPCTIGEHVREERLLLGLKLKQVAATFGLSPWTVSNWETGKTTPTTRDGPTIVRFLGRNPMPLETLSERLRALRFERGWTQEVAADAIGISEDRLQDLEAGRPVPTAVRERAHARVHALLEREALPFSPHHPLETA